LAGKGVASQLSCIAFLRAGDRTRDLLATLPLSYRGSLCPWFHGNKIF